MRSRRCQRFRKVAGGDALQIQPGQEVFQALGPAQIARQDRRREPDGAVRPVPDTGLAHAHRADPGLDGAFRQISIAHNPAAAGIVNKRRIGLQKRGDLGFDGLGQKLARPSLQDFRQRVFLKIGWAPKGDNGILFHGVSLLGFAQVVTFTITRIRRLQSNAVHKIRL